MDSNSHPHTLSNDEEDMDDQPFGNPDSAGTASLYFESFNMQAGHAGVSSYLLPYTIIDFRVPSFANASTPFWLTLE